MKPLKLTKENKLDTRNCHELNEPICPHCWERDPYFRIDNVIVDGIEKIHECEKCRRLYIVEAHVVVMFETRASDDMCDHSVDELEEEE